MPKLGPAGHCFTGQTVVWAAQRCRDEVGGTLVDSTEPETARRESIRPLRRGSAYGSRHYFHTMSPRVLQTIELPG